MCALGNYSVGHRFGKVALEMLKRFECSEWKPRVHTMVYSFIWDWNEPIHSAIEPLYKAHRLGLVTGDIETAMLAAYQYCVKLFYVASLEKLVSETTVVLERMEAYNHNLWEPYTSVILQVSHNLIGLSENPLLLTGQAMNEKEALINAFETKHVRFEMAVYFYGLVLAYTFNDYERALELAKKASGLKSSKVSTFNGCLLVFYEGLSAMALAKTCTSKREKKKCVTLAKQSIRRMTKLAKQVPSNCLHKKLLLEAEYDMLHGRDVDANMKYLECISCAQSEGFVHERALACERIGLAYYVEEKEYEESSPSSSPTKKKQQNLRELCPSGKDYLLKACQGYEEWGAHAKVEQMKITFPFLA